MKTVALFVGFLVASPALATPPRATWTSLGKFRSVSTEGGEPYDLTVSRRGSQLRVEAERKGLVVSSTGTIVGEGEGGRVLEVRFGGRAYSNQVATLMGQSLRSATNRSTLEFAGGSSLRVVSLLRRVLTDGTREQNESVGEFTRLRTAAPR